MAALGVAGVLLSAACGSSSDPGGKATVASGWDAVVAAAKKEGSLTVYHVPAKDLLNAQQKAWQKAYPEIKLNFVLLLSLDQIKRVEAEVAANTAGADAVVQGNFPWIAKKKSEKGFFQPIIGPNATSQEAISKKVIAEDRLSMLANINTFGYAWNKRVAGGDVSWDDITSGKYQGKVGMGDWCATTSQARQWFLMGEKLGGDEFFKKLAAAKPVFYSNPQPLAQALVSGEVAAAVMVSRGATQTDLVYNDDPAGSAEIGFARVPDAVFSSSFPGMILGNARHPNAAQVYFNWLLGPEAQAVQAKDTETALVGSNIPGATLDRATFLDVQFSVPADFDTAQAPDFKKHLSQIFNRPCPT